MSKKNRVKFNEARILIKAGSDFQYKSMMESLSVMILAFETFYKARHKNNKIQVQFVR